MWDAGCLMRIMEFSLLGWMNVIVQLQLLFLVETCSIVHILVEYGF